MEVLFRQHIQRLNHHQHEHRPEKFIANSNIAFQELVSLPAGFDALQEASDITLTILHLVADNSKSLGAILAVRVTPKKAASSAAFQPIEFRRHVFCKFQGIEISRIHIIDDVDALRNKEAWVVRPPTWTARPAMAGFSLRDAYRSYFNCVSNRTMAEDLARFTHDQIVFNGHEISREQYRGTMEECHDVMADCENTLENLIVNEDKQQLMARVVFEWTPIKMWNDIKPTGKRIKFSEHVFVWYDRGKMHTSISLLDMESFRQQIRE